MTHIEGCDGAWVRIILVAASPYDRFTHLLVEVVMKYKGGLLTLALANFAALVLLLGTPPQQAWAGVDACDEETAEGCDCGPAIPFSPAGCYENAIDELRCTTGTECDTPE